MVQSLLGEFRYGRSHVKRTLGLFLLALSVAFAPMVRAGQSPIAHHTSRPTHHAKSTKPPKAPKAQKAPKHAKAPKAAKAPKPPKNQYTTSPDSTKVHSSNRHRNSQNSTPDSFPSNN